MFEISCVVVRFWKQWEATRNICGEVSRACPVASRKPETCIGIACLILVCEPVVGSDHVPIVRTSLLRSHVDSLASLRHPERFLPRLGEAA